MPTKITKKDPVAEAILALAEAVKGLETKLDVVLTKPAEGIPATVPAGSLPPNDQVVAPATTPAAVTPVEYPFPFEWREVIDSLLNKAFKASVNYRVDGHFELSIFVPREYSNAKPAHWDTVHQDLRFAVLQNALGTAGVRGYTEKIVKDLGPDIMSKVIEDRAKLIHA